MIHKLLIIFFFAFTVIKSNPKNDFNCFTIIVGKNTSADGSVMVAHNEDDFGEQIVNLHRVEDLNRPQEDKIVLNNGGAVEQIDRTNGFIWIQLPGMKVADSYINNKGVVITSNGCPSREEAPDSTDGGILYWMRRLVAERSNSAREGVKIAGELIDRFGYVSSGRSYTIADKNEAWVLAAVYGKHWIAQRVPDDQVAVIPNYYTIRNIDLTDTMNFLGSADIISHAINNDWFDPDSEEEFDFAKTYTARTSINHPGNINRIWRGISLLSKDKYSIDDKLPFSFTPFKKFDALDIMNIMKDHYENSELDESSMYIDGNPHFKNNATICSESTQYSFILKLRDNLPLEIGTMLWFSYFRPCVNLYSPIYLSIKSFPEEFANTSSDYAMDFHFDPPEEFFTPSDQLAYWSFYNHVMNIDSLYSDRFPPLHNKNRFIQNDIFRKTIITEQEILNLYRTNPALALDSLNQFSRRMLNYVRDYTDGELSK